VAAQVDGVLLTLRIRRGARVAALRAVERLRSIDANILGIVVNGWEARGFSGDRTYEFGYGFANGYGYGATEDSDQGRYAYRGRRSNGDRQMVNPLGEGNSHG
jgi:Mrp family chromosome partitioning ATPase